MPKIRFPPLQYRPYLIYNRCCLMPRKSNLAPWFALPLLIVASLQTARLCEPKDAPVSCDYAIRAAMGTGHVIDANEIRKNLAGEHSGFDVYFFAPYRTVPDFNAAGLAEVSLTDELVAISNGEDKWHLVLVGSGGKTSHCTATLPANLYPSAPVTISLSRYTELRQHRIGP